MPETYTYQDEISNEAEKTADFESGRVDYSVIGELSEKRPIILVPGFTIGKLVQRDFANVLHNESDRQVIFADQPSFSRKSSVTQPVIDRHAEALLAIIEAEGLTDRPLDFITHSMGSLIFTRAAEMAEEKNLACFDEDFGTESGSRVIFIAPAGSNPDENIIKLGTRFSKFMLDGRPLGKELDPTGDWMKAGLKNFKKSPLKTAQEIFQLKKSGTIYKRLGRLGIKPALIGYPSDSLMPFNGSANTVMSEEAGIEGYSMPIDYTSLNLDGITDKPSLKKFKEVTQLEKQKAAKVWARHQAGAGHNDLLFNPYRTAAAVLSLLEPKAFKNGGKSPVAATKNRLVL